MARNFRQGQGFARPENALKRADELENVGQKQSALQALHDIICSKKHRTWSKTYESIMLKHIDLCVEMKKRNYAKEALMQYRNMCHQVNINSLEEVIKYFLKKASEKAEEAQNKAAAVTLDVEDLEEDASPEDLMLSYVSAEKGKDRTDRELVTPWFRFLWESYRSVLEILRTNPKLEPLYSMTANKAFQFCLQYKRTTEFKRLCDILRQHLTNLVNRYRDQRDQGPESMQMHLESRFEQLRVACELELWGEAFRSVEDIQQLIALTKRAPKQQQMATYYTRLTQIFAVSDSHLYHAFSWLKLFSFSRTYNRSLTQTDLQQMGTSVLLAALAMLPYDRSKPAGDAQSLDQEKERSARMATILGFAVDSKRDVKSLLTRPALLASISASHLLALVPPEVRAIHDLLSADFCPHELCTRLAPLLEKLTELNAQPMSAASPIKSAHLDKYVPTLKQAAVLRMLKQLSEVYSTMRISALAEMVPFATFSEVEAIVVDAVKFDYLQVRIDHRNGTLHFGSQQLESEKTRAHISLLAKRLTKAVVLLNPAPPAGQAAARDAAIQQAIDSMAQEHQHALARKVMIEKRKEMLERELLEAEREAEARKQQAHREAELAEERRRKEEIARREKDRIEREMEEREQQEMRALMEANSKKKVKDGEKLDKRAVMQDVLSERLKEQQDMERKLAKLARNMDHLERARREEEIPYLQAAWEKRQDEDRDYWNAQQVDAAQKHRQAWEVDIVEKKRLVALIPDKEIFKAAIQVRREEEFQALKKERERKVRELRERKKVEREMARRRLYVQRCQAEVLQRVQQMAEERVREEAERKKAEEAERQRKLDELAARQRARDEEIERRIAEERAAASTTSSGAAASGAGKFVPRHLRGAEGASAPAPAASEPRAEPRASAAPSAGAAGGDPDGWRGSGRVESSAAPAGAAAAPSEDRWQRGGGAGAGGAGESRRDTRDSAPLPAREDGDRWGRGGGSERREPGPPRDGPAPAPAGKFVPRREGAGEAPPPSSGGGGAYRPPGRR